MKVLPHIIRDFVKQRGMTDYDITKWEDIEHEFILYADNFGGYQYLLDEVSWSDVGAIHYLKVQAEKAFDSGVAGTGFTKIESPKPVQVEDDIQFEDSDLTDIWNRYKLWAERAIKRGYMPNLTITEYQELVTKQVCFYSGITFIEERGHPWSRTLERINPSRGYESGNVVAVTLTCNKAKASFDQFWKAEALPLEMKKLICKWASEAAE